MKLMETQTVIAHTQNWISTMVIGLNLCPFAESPFKANTIRYEVTDVTQPAQLLECLSMELDYLAASPLDTVVTSFLIHPNVLIGFHEFNEFLIAADQCLIEKKLQGTIQIIGFHPEYQFQDAGPDAVQNYTNRSPYPMLHLLREQSVTDVVGAREEFQEFANRNIETLEKLGMEVVLKKLEECIPPKKELKPLDPRKPLQGITLEMILVELVEEYGWKFLGEDININCFTNNPSIKSSLTFLRRTPWARTKVEELFITHRERPLLKR